MAVRKATTFAHKYLRIYERTVTTRRPGKSKNVEDFLRAAQVSPLSPETRQGGKKGCSELRRTFQSICSSLLYAFPSDSERLNSEALSTGAHRALS